MRLSSSGGLTKILRRLEKRGLVDRPPNPGDRRSHLVRLTAAGEQLLEAALDKVVGHEIRFLSPLTATEQEELTRLLDKLVAATPNAD